jgi:hypothetical protein
MEELWNLVGLFVFNIAIALFLYWLIRVPKEQEGASLTARIVY